MRVLVGRCFLRSDCQEERVVGELTPMLGVHGPGVQVHERQLILYPCGARVRSDPLDWIARRDLNREWLSHHQGSIDERLSGTNERQLNALAGQPVQP